MSYIPSLGPFDVSPLLGRQKPFSFQDLNPNADMMGPTFKTPVQTPSPFTIDEHMGGMNARPATVGSPFDILSPEDQQLAVTRGKQAYGNQLLGAAFNGSWEALGTAFSKANQAKQEVSRKSQESSLKDTQDNLKFVSDQEDAKLKRALDTARLAEENRRTGVLDRQDLAIQKMVENNPAMQQAFTDYQAKIDNETDPDAKKAYGIKLASAKAQVALYSSAGTPEAAQEIFSVVNKLADEVGSDAMDREKLDKAEQLAARNAGYGTDIAAFRKGRQEYSEAKTDRLNRPPAPRASGDPGQSQGAFATEIGKESKTYQGALATLRGAGKDSDRIKAAAALGLSFVPGRDADELGNLKPEYEAKLAAIDPNSLAQSNVQKRHDAAGITVKGIPKGSMADDLLNGDKGLQKDPAYSALKARGYQDATTAAVLEAKKRGASPQDIAVLVLKLEKGN